jgi:hypothetical protein
MGYRAHSPVPETISCYSNNQYMVWACRKNSCFSCCVPPFPWGIAHSFHVFLPISWAITFISSSQGDFQLPQAPIPGTVTTGTWFERCRKNSCFSCLLPPFSRAIPHNFHVFCPFHGISSTFSGSQEDFQLPYIQIHVLRGVAKARVFAVFYLHFHGL